MHAVRKALDYAEKQLKIKRLLLSEELRTYAGALFIEHLGYLIDLGLSGQMVLKGQLEGYLKRVDWYGGGGPFRLFPVLPMRGLQGPKIVGIDPKILFGKPFIVGKGVRTLTIVERIDAGEDREEVAADYDLEPAEIEEAIFYERAA